MAEISGIHCLHPMRRHGIDRMARAAFLRRHNFERSGWEAFDNGSTARRFAGAGQARWWPKPTGTFFVTLSLESTRSGDSAVQRKRSSAWPPLGGTSRHPSERLGSFLNLHSI